MPDSMACRSPGDLQSLTGKRLGPYLSFNPVSRVQVWQWCAAMGDRNPLYLDERYHHTAGIDRIIAPPAMMQMWTMRDVNLQYAAGSTDAAPYAIFDTLQELGFPGNVAVSYDITFHRYLLEHDRAHHYTTVVAISELKNTALGDGHFVTEKVEYLDQHQQPFAEALITYFQYRPVAVSTGAGQRPDADGFREEVQANGWQPDFSDVHYTHLHEGLALPELAIPITRKLIVAGAVATQDFIDVHHNAPAARAAAMPDIFMNILTTCGLSARYLSDWAGPQSRMKKLKFKLAAPNLPGDTMVMRGRVGGLVQRDGENLVTVDFAGKNSRGYHVTGAATLAVVA